MSGAVENPKTATSQAEFTLGNMIKAKEAGANGDPAWLEEHFGDLIVDPKPIRIQGPKLALMTVYRHGLELLYDQCVGMKQLDPTDNDMANPKTPITTTSTISGLISGLYLNENPAFDEEMLRKPGGLDWALGYRLGCALKKGQKPAPLIDKKLKELIHPIPARIAI